MQLSNEPAEELAKLLVATSGGAFTTVGFVSGGMFPRASYHVKHRVWTNDSPHYPGTEAMEACIKTATQYFYEQGEPKRVNFIGRKMSFHGNSIGTLSLGHHPGRRAPYVGVLNEVAFHHVSPAYARRYKKEGETDEAYVQRLADELEAKFQELGPGTVAACESVSL